MQDITGRILGTNLPQRAPRTDVRPGRRQWHDDPLPRRQALHDGIIDGVGGTGGKGGRIQTDEVLVALAAH